MTAPKNLKPVPAMRLHPVAACLTAACALSSPLAQAAVSTVMNCNDHGSDSLRAAVAASTDGTVIDLSALACSTITLTTGAIIINHAVANLTLAGPANSTLTIAAGDHSRVLVHNGEGTLTLDHLTVTHGSYLSGYYGGGCIYAFGSVTMQYSTVSNCTLQLPSGDVRGGGIYAKGNLTLTRSVLSGNQAINSNGPARGGGAYVKHNFTANFSSIRNNLALAPGSNGNGGGISTYGTTQVYSSTFSANQADYGGAIRTRGATFGNSTISGNQALIAVGGIYAVGNLTLNNSTVAYNTQSSQQFGAGVLMSGDVMVASSSIIANNTSTESNKDFGLRCLFGATLAGSNNLITASRYSVPVGTITLAANLAPLADNGGPTLTHALKSGSPAIDAGIDAHDFDFDQRGAGYARKIGANPDIGAFELNTVDLIFSDGFD